MNWKNMLVYMDMDNRVQCTFKCKFIGGEGRLDKHRLQGRGQY